VTKPAEQRLIEKALVTLPVGTLDRLREKARREGTLHSRIMRNGILMALERPDEVRKVPERRDEECEVY
jgi:hypothetical protein